MILASLVHTIVAAAPVPDPYAIHATDVGLDSNVKSIGGVMTAVIKALLILIGSLSIVFVVVGGLQMVLSAGSPQRFKSARETIIYAIVGLGIAIGAYAIVTFITTAAKG